MLEISQNVALRPTLLVFAADEDSQSRSLAELLARRYAQTMRRLTGKFSPRQWDVVVLNAEDLNLLQKAWLGFEKANMAIITGYNGTKTQNESLSKIQQASQPILTLVTQGQNDINETGNSIAFHKVAHILPGKLEEQANLIADILIDTRDENSIPRNDNHFQL